MPVSRTQPDEFRGGRAQIEPAVEQVSRRLPIAHTLSSRDTAEVASARHTVPAASLMPSPPTAYRDYGCGGPPVRVERRPLARKRSSTSAPVVYRYRLKLPGVTG